MKTAVKVERSELDKYYLKRMSKKLTLGLKTALYTHSVLEKDITQKDVNLHANPCTFSLSSCTVMTPK